MSVKIRLARGGSKKRPYYRIVIADARAPRDGKYIEKVGNYNPMLAKDNDNRVVLNQERLQYWISQGAQPTDRVSRFLSNAGLMADRKIPAQTKKHLQSEKTLMKIQEKEEKIKAAKEAQEAAAAEAAEAAEAAKEAAE